MSDVWKHIWSRKKRLIGIWLIVMVLVLIRLLTMREVFTSTSLLMPLPLEQVEQGGIGGFGGSSVRSLLAGGGTPDSYAVAAFFESGRLTDAVISDLHLDRELFPRQWDAEDEEWRGDAPHPGKSRRVFRRHVDVGFDAFTGLLQLEVHWWSAERARLIATRMIDTADSMLREAAIEDGERRVEELRHEMQTVAFSEIGEFLAEETTSAIASLASIRARSGYAFRVIDPPVLPDKKSWPPRLLLLILAGLAVGVIEIGVTAGAYARRTARGRTEPV